MKARLLGLRIVVLPILAIVVGLSVLLWRVKTAHDYAFIPSRRIVLPQPYPHMGQAASGLAFSPDGKILVSADTQSSLRFWDARTLRQTLEAAHTEDWADWLQWTPDGKTLAVGGSSGLRLWNATLTKPGLLYFHVPLRMPAVDYIAQYVTSPNGQLVAGTGITGNLTVWNAVSGQRLFAVLGEHARGWGTGARQCGVAFSHDGRLLATALLPVNIDRILTPSMQITLRDARTGKVLRRWSWQGDGLMKLGQSPGNLHDVGLAFSPDDLCLACVSSAQTVLWNTKTVHQIRCLDDPQQSYWQTSKLLLFVPYSHLLAGVGWGDKVKVWNTENGHLEQVFHGADYTSALAVSPDGKILASGGEDKITGSFALWNLSRPE